MIPRLAIRNTIAKRIPDTRTCRALPACYGLSTKHPRRSGQTNTAVVPASTLTSTSQLRTPCPQLSLPGTSTAQPRIGTDPLQILS